MGDFTFTVDGLSHTIRGLAKKPEGDDLKHLENQARTRDAYSVNEKLNELPPGTLRSIGFQESSFNPAIVSGKKAGLGGTRGLMQMTKPTGMQYGLTRTNFLVPEAQVAAAGRFVAAQIAREKGDFVKGLSHYNVVNPKWLPSVLSRIPSYQQRGESPAEPAPTTPVPAATITQPAGSRPSDANPPRPSLIRVGGGGLIRPGQEGFGTLRAPEPGERAAELAIPLASTIGSAAAMALVPELEGPLLVMRGLQAVASMFGGLVPHVLGKTLAREPITKTGLAMEAVADAFPVVLGASVNRLVFTKNEESALLRFMREKETRTVEQSAALAAAEAPIPKPDVPKPGRAPKALKTDKIKEPLIQVSPLTGESVPPTVGPEMTKVATEAVSSVENSSRAFYDAETARASKLKLEGNFPTHRVEQAQTALAEIDASDLSGPRKTEARKVLEAIANQGSAEVRLGGQSLGRMQTGTPEKIAYGRLDAWRRTLQELVPSFEQGMGRAPKTAEQSALSKLLSGIKQDMREMAHGTPVEDLARVADEHFVNTVQPTRRAARTILRGESEPGHLVDILTTPRHEQKIIRFLEHADAKSPATALKYRTLKFQNMVQRSMRNGAFDAQAFEAELEKMKVGTQNALTKNGPIKEMLADLKEGRRYTADMRADEVRTMKVKHAAEMAKHEQLTVEYDQAKVRYQRDIAAQQLTIKELQTGSADLKNAKSKLAKQRALLTLPPRMFLAAHALTDLIAGKISMGAWETIMTVDTIPRIMATPGAVRIANKLFSALRGGVSKRLVSRYASQLMSHLVGHYGGLALQPETDEQ